MSDERLRELERRWKETGAADDEAAFLLERVRCGNLDPKRLEVAWSCGFEPARLALAKQPEQASSAEDVISGLCRARWSAEALGRACSAIVNLLLNEATRLVELIPELAVDERPPRSVQQAAAAIERWARDPDDRDVLAFRSRLDRLARPERDPSLCTQVVHEAVATAHLVTASSYPSAYDSFTRLFRPVLQRTYAERDTALILRSAIRSDVVPWLLDDRDPVRERLEATRPD